MNPALPYPQMETCYLFSTTREVEIFSIANASLEENLLRRFPCLALLTQALKKNRFPFQRMKRHCISLATGQEVLGDWIFIVLQKIQKGSGRMLKISVHRSILKWTTTVCSSIMTMLPSTSVAKVEKAWVATMFLSQPIILKRMNGA